MFYCMIVKMKGLTKIQQKKIITKVQKYFSTKTNIGLVLIYGSFARAEAKSNSDLDLGLVHKQYQALSATLKIKIVNELALLIGHEVDLVDLTQASGTILKEALTKGQIIKSTHAELLTQLLKKLCFQEEDFEKYRRTILKDRRRLAFYG